jgi:hypothetical protein
LEPLALECVPEDLDRGGEGFPGLPAPSGRLELVVVQEELAFVLGWFVTKPVFHEPGSVRTSKLLAQLTSCCLLDLWACEKIPPLALLSPVFP